MTIQVDHGATREDKLTGAHGPCPASQPAQVRLQGTGGPQGPQRANLWPPHPQPLRARPWLTAGGPPWLLPRPLRTSAAGSQRARSQLLARSAQASSLPHHSPGCPCCWDCCRPSVSAKWKWQRPAGASGGQPRPWSSGRSLAPACFHASLDSWPAQVTQGDLEISPPSLPQGPFSQGGSRVLGHRSATVSRSRGRLRPLLPGRRRSWSLGCPGSYRKVLRKPRARARRGRRRSGVHYRGSGEAAPAAKARKAMNTQKPDQAGVALRCSQIWFWEWPCDCLCQLTRHD